MLTESCKACLDQDYMDDCPVCNDTGRVPVPEEQMVYVNVYEITRHYGGPEEGGWYYNNYDCLETYPVRNKNACIIEAELREQYKHLTTGDIYSVLGGTLIEVCTDMKPKERETTERPYYE